jgi:predicted ferric reductase
MLGISIGFLRTYATYHFLKHVFYPRVHKYLGGTTRYHALLILALLVGNVLCLAGDRTKIVQRTGRLTIVNLVPLALGSYMNSIVSCCGLGYESYNAIHCWLGRVAVIKGVIHAIIAVVLQKPNLHSSTQVAALVVSVSPAEARATDEMNQAASTMAAILITSFLIVRRYFYKIFLNIHQVLAVIVVTATWIHVPGKLFSIPTIYLLAVCCL